ncbi:hypothetical protein V1264_018228 [Littorina saxatilis]|uniref:EGF-like domain-containing protein n=2 Tax=Littorina saxatilis TaxID=31220 RepID=A0AAN9BEL2_9CAEN
METILVLLTVMLLGVWSHPHCSSPGLCQNGGTCVESINSARCLCPPGFTGLTCSAADYCSSSPCQNGGSCGSMTSSYTCTCLAGFTGIQCETVVSACSSSPCVRGQCHDLGAGYECQCDAGYTDTRCDVEVDYCSSAPCGSHGKCVEEVTGGYSCHCKSDYLGLNCEEHISQQCGQSEESFCMCEVNGAPVKVPIPPPSAHSQGANTRDVIMGLTGLLIGWAVGSGVMALYRCCCRGTACLGDGCCVGTGRRSYPTKPTGVRPASTGSTVSTLDSLRSDSPDSQLDSPRRPPPSYTPTSTAPPPSDSAGQRPMNVYRAGFTDNLSHQTAERKSAGTYTSGHKDW